MRPTATSLDVCKLSSSLYVLQDPSGRALHALQGAYKQELRESHGISFNNLLCLNNMPIKRYVDYLQRRGQLEEYMQVLSPAM